MKMNKLFVALIVSLGLFSCQPEGRVFSENQELSPQVEWLKKDVLEFKVPIEDNSSAYNMSLTFRFATGYQYRTANVKVTETSPSGNEVVKEYELTVIKSNGEYIGDGSLDIWDSEHLVESDKKYEETGTYTYKIEQNMPVDPLNYAMELGLILDKAK
ncbi:MAG: hypothetical protein COA38_16195 [Fluviicola sp.]|nr:MAG: hypothetical protein COA38_16195 [Fluviicola sp.]